MPRQPRIPIHPASILKHLSPSMLYGRFVKESQYLASLHYNLQAVGWQDLVFFPDGFGGNASFLYLLFKVLYNEKPQTILELGSGQSTFFTSRYAKENNATLLILEDNSYWYELFQSKIFTGEKIRYVLAPLTEIRVQKKKRRWYNTTLSQDEDTRYQLIIVDGPPGDYRFSRLGILAFIPKIIDPANFIIIFDDSARKGERDTISRLGRILRQNKIPYCKFHVYGSKRQTCIASKRYSYISTQWCLF